MPNWNIAITDNAYVITADEPEMIQPMHFGLVPHHSTTGKVDFDSFNSRDDNLLKSKTWKPLVVNHKTCLVLSDSFFEWKRIPDGKKFIKEPYRFVVRDRPVFSMPVYGRNGLTLLQKRSTAVFLSLLLTQMSSLARFMKRNACR
jgi:putative SOS response-associated peptidase YedK